MSVLKEILEALSASLRDKELTIGEIIYHPYKILYGDLAKIYKKNTLDQSFVRAQKRGLIKRTIVNDETYVAITELGRKFLGSDNEKPKIDPGADGKETGYTVVFFDIPEKNRSVRDALRDELKRAGFVGWQQSVWVSKRRIKDGVINFLEQVGLEDHVMVIETPDLDNQKKKSLR